MSVLLRQRPSNPARQAKRVLERDSARPNRHPVSGEQSPVKVPRASSDEEVPISPPKSSDGVTNSKPPTASSGSEPGVNKTTATPIRPLDITVPGEINRYTIGKRIGSGTCGVVHQALDNLLGRDVAVKLSPIGEAHLSTGKVPGAQRAYQTEIIAAGRLTHPNIVTVHDAGQFEELNYLVMEVIEGKSLKEYGKGKTLLPVHEALRIISECCLALDYSHEQGILHRDIKPANIMLAENGNVKLLDFGIAVGLDGHQALKRQGPTLGTPNYMSPEQILGRDLGPPSDFYSLATVLFELLTGRQLFKAKKVKDLFRTVVHKRAPRLHDVSPDLPVELSAVLARALEKKPHLRFQSGREFAAALAPFAASFSIVENRPLAEQRLIKQLQSQPFFKPFSNVEIAQLLGCVKVRNFAVHETLIATGEADRRLFIITDGMVQADSEGRFMQLIGEGECVGEAGFINGTAEAQNVTAITPVNVLELSTESLGELPPKVHLHYYRHISEILVSRNANAGVVKLDIEF